jgi:hypothetical protein
VNQASIVLTFDLDISEFLAASDRDDAVFSNVRESALDDILSLRLMTISTLGNGLIDFPSSQRLVPCSS